MPHKLIKKEQKKIQKNHLDDYIRFSRLLESGFALYGVTRGDAWELIACGAYYKTSQLGLYRLGSIRKGVSYVRGKKACDLQ